MGQLFMCGSALHTSDAQKLVAGKERRGKGMMMGGDGVPCPWFRGAGMRRTKGRSGRRGVGGERGRREEEEDKERSSGPV